MNSLQDLPSDLEKLLKKIVSKPKRSLSTTSFNETDLGKLLSVDDDLESNLTNFITQSQFPLFIFVTSYMYFKHYLNNFCSTFKKRIKTLFILFNKF